MLATKGYLMYIFLDRLQNLENNDFLYYCHRLQKMAKAFSKFGSDNYNNSKGLGTTLQLQLRRNIHRHFC